MVSTAIPLIFFTLIPAPSVPKEPDVNTIIQRSVEANDADWKAAPQYACVVREQEDDKKPRTFEELMIEGSPYKRLLAINGQKLSPADQKKQEQMLQETIAKRQKESPQERQQRITEYERERNRDHVLMGQFANAFQFRLLGRQKLDGHEVFAVRATPRPGYKASSRETQVLTGMQGRLWIDTKDFQWVKVEAEVVRPVQIEGFLARVEPGTRFELEKMPVSPDIWLAQHFSMRSRAQVLYVFNKKNQEDDTYSNCHRQPS